MSLGKSPLETRILREHEFPAWRTLVDASPAGSVYSYPEYLDVLCRAAGGSFRILGVFRGQEIQGGIALYERSSIAGRILTGRLLLYYNGIVLKRFTSKRPSENSSREVAILGALESAMAGMGFAHVSIRNRHPLSDLRVFLKRGWGVHPSYSYIIRLADLNGAAARIEQNQWRLIRRCEAEGARLTADHDFDSFSRLHVGTHVRKGAPIYLDEDRLRFYVDGLRSQNLCQLFQVRLRDGRTAACQLVLLGGHPIAHTVAAAADPELLSLGATPFLRWKVCEALSAAGYEGNDLTDASLNEVTRFKSQMGGDLVMNLVLSRPDTLRYRVIRFLGSNLNGMRAGVGRALRAMCRHRKS